MKESPFRTSLAEYIRKMCYRNPNFLLKYHVLHCTVRVDSLPHRKWKEIQQQPGTGGPGNMLGCCLISFHFRWGKLSTRTVVKIYSSGSLRTEPLEHLHQKWVKFCLPLCLPENSSLEDQHSSSSSSSSAARCPVTD